MTGSQAERDLVNALEACGWRCLRAPGSGGATDRDSPDVLAGRAKTCTHKSKVYTRSDALAIELKTTSSTTAYVDAEEVTALERFAHDFGARPLLGAKFKGAGTRTRFWLVPTTDARMTDGGRFGLPEADIAERAVKVVLPATDTMDAEVRDV